ALAGGGMLACRPNYPVPQVNQATIAPLARTNANNARIMVFNALVDLSPDPENSPNYFYTVSVDGQELPNLNGTRGVIFSQNFRLDGTTIVPLSRKYPAAATFAGIAGAPEQSSSYAGIAFTGTPPSGFSTATPFTNFAQAVPASVINNVEVTPAQPEVGIFIPGGRRNITFNNALGEPASPNLRVNTNLGAGSLTSIFLRGVIGTNTGSTAEGSTIITETLPATPASGSMAIRFLNLASDLGDVHLLTANASAPSPMNVDRRPMLAFPSPPAGTRFRADQGKTPAQQDSLRAVRDSLASRSRYIPTPTATNPYGFFSRSYTANNTTLSSIVIERNTDGELIPNYTFSVPVTSYSTRPAGTYTFNFYYPNRRHTTPVLSKNVTFNFASGGIFTIVLHGNATKGYKCDIIRMN
ncbi:MAG: DUF4397 domain-containing protein, partial [Raineya sp.]|nr:DUF4397 domain-containing protein [Raineya sp.]